MIFKTNIIMHKVSFSYWFEMFIFFNMYDTLGEILFRTFRVAKWNMIEKKYHVSNPFFYIILMLYSKQIVFHRCISK